MIGADALAVVAEVKAVMIGAGVPADVAEAAAVMMRADAPANDAEAAAVREVTSAAEESVKGDDSSRETVLGRRLSWQGD
eukprot:365869-Chlamydomonas_euryale.AAC.2